MTPSPGQVTRSHEGPTRAKGGVLSAEPGHPSSPALGPGRSGFSGLWPGPELHQLLSDSLLAACLSVCLASLSSQVCSSEEL